MRIRFRDVFAVLIWCTSSLFFYLSLTDAIPNNQYTGMVIGNLVTLTSLVVQFYFRKKPRGETDA